MPLTPNYRIDPIKVSDILPRAKLAWEKLQQTTAYHFPKAFVEESGKAVKDIAQSVVKAPLRIGQTFWDVGQQAYGQEPSRGYNVPLLGKVEGYGRQFLNEAGEDAGDWTNPNTARAGIEAISQGIGDAAVLGDITQGLLRKVASRPETLTKKAYEVGGYPTKPEGISFIDANGQPIGGGWTQHLKVAENALKDTGYNVPKNSSNRLESIVHEFGTKSGAIRVADVDGDLALQFYQKPTPQQLTFVKKLADKANNIWVLFGDYADRFEGTPKNYSELVKQVSEYFAKNPTVSAKGSSTLLETTLPSFYKNLPKSAQEFIKEPKLGLSIKDVSSKTLSIKTPEQYLTDVARKYKNAEEFINKSKREGVFFKENFISDKYMENGLIKDIYYTKDGSLKGNAPKELQEEIQNWRNTIRLGTDDSKLIEIWNKANKK